MDILTPVDPREIRLNTATGMYDCLYNGTKVDEAWCYADGKSALDLFEAILDGRRHCTVCDCDLLNTDTEVSQ